MKRRIPWLLVGVLLFAAAAWLMSRGDEPTSEKEAPRVSFPRQLRKPEVERMEKRRTLPVAATIETAQDDEQPQKPALRDPVLAALPSGEGRTTVVLEANALTNSPVGSMLLECLRARSGSEDPFEMLKERTGVDPLQQIDRVAVSDDVFLVSGHFADARWDEVFRDASSRSYGDKGRVYYPRRSDGKSAGGFAVWDDQMLIVGNSDEEIARSIDRLEGRVDPGEPAIPEQSTYGEIYGVIDAETMSELLPEGREDLAGLLRDAAQRIELHVDARGDVAIAAKVEGRDGAQVDELSRSLGAALAVARLKAKAEGEDELVELLDLARVSPRGEGFNLELALPMAVLEKHLSKCGEWGRPDSSAAQGAAEAPQSAQQRNPVE